MSERAGHWKHNWVPLDVEAAMSKFHGRVPKGWFPPGTGAKTKTSHAPHGSDWIKLANWRDSTDYQTGYKSADIGRTADFHATVRESHAHGAAWNSKAKQYDYRVFRQRTEREGPDAHGSHWSGDYATGTEATMAKAKSSAQQALKEHRRKHIAAGGDYGYGAESRRTETWAARWIASWVAAS